MIDPVISLSRLKESVGAAHEPGVDAARNRLRNAMAQEEDAQRALPARPVTADRASFALPVRFTGLRMAGALATVLIAITMVSNQLSPTASGNADEVAARLRAQTGASLTLLSRTAADDARARRRDHRDAKRPAPVFILPPANVVAPDPDDFDEPIEEPVVEPTEPTGEPTDENGADEDGEVPTADDEDTTPDEESGSEPDAPTQPKPSPPASDTPEGGSSTVPSQGGTSLAPTR